jgi:hypothetical protein
VILDLLNLKLNVPPLHVGGLVQVGQIDGVNSAFKVLSVVS